MKKPGRKDRASIRLFGGTSKLNSVFLNHLFGGTRRLQIPAYAGESFHLRLFRNAKTRYTRLRR